MIYCDQIIIYTNIVCNSRDTGSCSLYQNGIPYSCSLLSSSSCGCTESSIESSVIFLIDNTRFVNDYSWYYWAIDWIRFYQRTVLINQPLIRQNVTYIHIGDHVSNYKVTQNYNEIENTQITAGDIFNNTYNIPSIFVNNTAPNFCDAIQFALDIHSDSDNLILIYLANSSPLLPNTNSTCNQSGYDIQLNDIPLHIIRSGSNVNITAIKNEFSVGLVSTMMDTYNNETDDWGSNYNETTKTYSSNTQMVTQMVENIVSSAADFICLNSDLCESIIYSSTPSKQCSNSCASNNTNFGKL